jgi:hypothetical protein
VIRWLTGITGVGLLLFGVLRLLTQVAIGDLLVLGVWLAGALLLHDGVVAPATARAGRLIGRLLPARPRRYVQGGLVAGLVVTVVALPLIARGGSQPPQKALLRQNYPANLAILLGAIAACAALLYALRVARDRSAARRTRQTKLRPPAIHDSSTT